MKMLLISSIFLCYLQCSKAPKPPTPPPAAANESSTEAEQNSTEEEAAAEAPAPPCPTCHRNDSVVPVMYGKPSRELAARAQKGEVWLAGCVVTPNAPRWHCKRDSLSF